MREYGRVDRKGDRAIYLSEVLRFLRIHWKKGGGIFLLGSLLSFVGVWGFFPRHYRAEALFRQAEKPAIIQMGESSLDALMKAFQSGLGQSHAKPLMHSKILLTSVVKDGSLQIYPREKGVYFSHVQGNIADAQSFSIVPLSDSSYEVLSKKGEKVGAGSIGVPFFIGDEGKKVGWTLQILPSNGQTLSFQILPLSRAVKLLERRLKIKRLRREPHLLHLFYSHPVRESALGVLRSVIESYRRFLQAEHTKLAKVQIAYLKERRRSLEEELSEVLDQYAAYLERSMEKGGFLNFDQHAHLLIEPKEKYTALGHELDLELERVKSWELEARHDLPLRKDLRGELWEEKIPLPISDKAEEFADLDLKVAKNLYDQYLRQRDLIASMVKELDQILSSELEPAFLPDSLNDEVGRKISDQMTGLMIQIADRDNYSEKERLRFTQSLKVQKEHLRNHLESRRFALFDQLDLCEVKLGGLRKSCLHLIRKEQGSIGDKLEEIGNQMEELPVKWRFENLLKLKKELIVNVMEQIVNLSESKALHHQLFPIQSKAIDPPYAPLKAIAPPYMLLASLGGILSSFVFFLISFAKALQNGLPLCRESLEEVGFTFLGYVREREKIAQRLIAHLPDRGKIAIVGFSRPSLFHSLVHSLEKAGYEADQIIDCTEGIFSPKTWQAIKNVDKVVVEVDREQWIDLALFEKDKTLCVLKN